MDFETIIKQLSYVKDKTERALALARYKNETMFEYNKNGFIIDLELAKKEIEEILEKMK